MGRMGYPERLFGVYPLVFFLVRWNFVFVFGLWVLLVLIPNFLLRFLIMCSYVGLVFGAFFFVVVFG